jgi:hypothetical protein
MTDLTDISFLSVQAVLAFTDSSSMNVLTKLSSVSIGNIATGLKSIAISGRKAERLFFLF